jgi:hypothetical protein
MGPLHLPSKIRRWRHQERSLKKVAREALILLAFILLTLLMTWPWVLHLRDAVNDRLDSYAHAYFLWWDYQQTLRDPRHLFDANIFYPYHQTLAFGENDYGISLLMSPFMMLGLRPLTVHGIAILLGFALSGYGMFRLARTLTNSNLTACVAGVVFAFVPYRFGQLDRLPLVFAGWIPLLLEALVLFARERSWKRAAWLGCAFLMNTLTCLTWFVLTLVPLGLSAIFMVARGRLWLDRRFWVRACVGLCAATLLLLPFLLPFYEVSKTFGYVRNSGEVAAYSVLPVHWLAVGGQNRLWKGMGAHLNVTSELALFPGLLPLLLSLAAVLLVNPSKALRDASREKFFGLKSAKVFGLRRRAVLIFFDALILCLAVIALLSIGYRGFRWSPFGFTLLRAGSSARALVFLLTAVIIRCLLAPPLVVRAALEKGRLAAFRASLRGEAFAHGLIWTGAGFFGSLGLNFIFHRALYELIPLFRSMRVVARWSMICYLGLALLSGIGAARVVELLARHWPVERRALVCGLILLALLCEQRTAPLHLVRGEVDADALSQRLALTNMNGGIVDLPAGRAGAGNQRYMLRAADHARPIVVATQSFTPPLERELETLTRERPIPDHLMDLLESIPASYLVVHQAYLSPRNYLALRDFLARGTSAGRIRFIQRYGYQQRDGLKGYTDLYAVTKTEPASPGEAAPPPAPAYQDYLSRWQNLPQGFQDSGYFIYRLHKASFGRAPLLAEFGTEMRALASGPEATTAARSPDQAARLPDQPPTVQEQTFHQERTFHQGPTLQQAQAFITAWTNRADFKALYDDLPDPQYLDSLCANAGVSLSMEERGSLLLGLHDGALTRDAVLSRVLDDESFLLRDFDAAFVLMNYFAYLWRDPDEGGYQFWLDKLDESGDYGSVSQSFISSYEHHLKARRP